MRSKPMMIVWGGTHKVLIWPRGRTKQFIRELEAEGIGDISEWTFMSKMCIGGYTVGACKWTQRERMLQRNKGAEKCRGKQEEMDK